MDIDTLALLIIGGAVLYGLYFYSGLESGQLSYSDWNKYGTSCRASSLFSWRGLRPT